MHKTTVYIPGDVKRALGRAAAARGVSEAELIREALRAFTSNMAPPRQVSADGRLVLAPEGRAVGKIEIRRLRQFLGRQKETAPVVGGMRGVARY